MKYKILIEEKLPLEICIVKKENDEKKGKINLLTTFANKKCYYSFKINSCEEMKDVLKRIKCSSEEIQVDN